MTQTFKTYSEARDWVEAGEAAMGKMKFRSTPEYHAAHAHIDALYKAENPVRKPRKRVTRSICLFAR